MLRITMLALGASLTMGALAPNDAAAQTGRERAEASKRGGVIVEGRRDSRTDARCFADDRYEHRGRADRDDDSDSERYKGKKNKRNDRYGNRNDCDDVYGVNQVNKRKGNGPPFCRDGRGHPTKGREWCREKGWGLANTGWSDVILRRPRYDARGDLGTTVLQDILGRTVYGRFDNQRYRLGVNSPLVGRWSDGTSGTLLNLFAGGLQIAQILDRNRDGRADVVLMNYGESGR
jgi:hypothetical protein